MTIGYPAAIAGLALILSGCQEGFIFFPQPPGPPPAQALDHRIEKVELAVPGASLSGWFVRAATTGKAPLVIYFGGNAEEVSWIAGEAHRLPGWSVLAVNYRGYGHSSGSPGEAALFADALAIHDHAAARPDVDAARIVAMGRSLGSGVAVHLAAHRPLAGVVLVTPFDSLVAVAERHYPFLPVRLLLRQRFDSISHASSLTMPALVIAAQHDAIVPPVHARRLFEAWKGPREWVVIEGAGHNDIDSHSGFWRAASAFLQKLR